MNIYNHNNLFLNNKYTRWYYLIISKAQNSNRVKLKRDNLTFVYYENHHILPKCMFPEYANLKEHKWNGVLLNAREHFICHALLCKMVINKKHIFQMTNAFSRMYNQINEYQQRYKSKLYERLRFKIKMTEETRLKMSISRIGKIHSQETKNKIGAKHKNKIISQETREKTSKWMKENPATKETILKITLANTGKVRSEQSKQNYKNSWTKERRDERSKQVKARTNMNLIKYKAEHIDGRVFIIDNINDWCKENFVNISTLKGTLGGKFSRKY